MTTLLKNSKMYAEYREERKEIFMRDLTDQLNDPAEYNKTRRGIKKAWIELCKKFNPEMRMADASTILTDNGIRMHYWCMVD